VITIAGTVAAAGLPLAGAEWRPAGVAARLPLCTNNIAAFCDNRICYVLRLSPTDAECAEKIAGKCPADQPQGLPPWYRARQKASGLIELIAHKRLPWKSVVHVRQMYDN